MSDVRAWLESLGLGQYTQPFSEQGIEYDQLSDLTGADLEACGVNLLGHRKRLLKSIGQISTATANAAGQGSPIGAQLSPIAKPAGERRHLTVMFCDLVGATALSTQEDPEDLRLIVAEYQEAVRAAVAPYDGYVAQLLGDGVLVFFGYPRAHEDEAICAVRAALEVIRTLANCEFAGGLHLQARVGIATGLVVVGEIGAGTPAAETGVSGEAPNLAARLQSAALPMSILIANETRRRVGEVFDLEALGEIELKGFPLPQAVWHVLRERAGSTRFEALRAQRMTHLVGRDGELNLLRERWMLARNGEAETVLLSAEAGMGKSRISRALCDQIEQDGGLALILQCSPHHRASVLHPVTRWLERTANVSAADPDSARSSKLDKAFSAMGIELSEGERQCIGALVSPTELASDLSRLQPIELQRAIQGALASLLSRLASLRPLLVLIEDAHWIDPTTDEFLMQIAQRLRDRPVLTLITGRPQYQPDWAIRSSVTRLTLNRLGRKACGAIAADVAGKPLPDEVIEQILLKTDGVPLFVEEFTRTVLRSELLAERETLWELTGPLRSLSVPSTLQDSLMARLDQLSLAKEVVQVAAAVGRDFDVKVVARVLDVERGQLLVYLAELQDEGLVLPSHDDPTISCSFRHALVRDVAYDSMLKSVRVRYHASIARALEEAQPEIASLRPEILAQHYEEGCEDKLAWRLWIRAGDIAAKKGYAFAQALEFYERAWSILNRAQPSMPEEMLDLLLLKEAGLARLSRRDQQMSTIDAAITIAQSLHQPGRLAKVLLRRASACAYVGDYARALQAGMHALELYRETNDRPGEADALRELGFLNWRAEDYNAALQHAREALRAHRSLGDPSGEATALHNLAEIHHSLGSPRQALELYDQAIQLHWAVGNHEGEILTLFGMANALQQSQDVNGSTQKYEKALELSERYGERTMQSRALHALAIQARTQAALSKALEFVRRAIEIDRAINYAHGLSHDLVELCAIHLALGEAEESRAALQEALTWCEFTGDQLAIDSTRVWLNDLDAGRTPALGVSDRAGWVKSHVSLPEGKVYCEFESPLANLRKAQM